MIEKNTAAVVLAGGSGRRMKTDVKKQYIEIQGKPLIYYALTAFQKSCVEKIVLVVSPGDEAYCREELVERYGFDKVCAIVSGGKERYHSVYNGLCALDKTETNYVLIHDGARPFITKDIIRRTVESVKQYKACVVGMPSKDTVKIADVDGYVDYTPKRSCVWNVQTPQAFSYEIVRDSYEKIFEYEDRLEITDDAMVVEYITKMPVKLIEGSYSNIKITTVEDLVGIENYSFE